MERDALVQAVDAWVTAHRAELVRDVIRVVNIPSVSRPGDGGYAMGPGCKACGDLFLALAEGYGFPTENDDDYCVSVLYPGTGRGELGILGHLDVVPEGKGWHFAPYDAVERDGFIIGRGSSDNKGPTVMGLYVLRCMRDLGIHLGRTVRLIAGFNEEAGMRDVEHYLAGHTPPDYTLVCDGGWAMCIGEKGLLTADLVLEITGGNLVGMGGGIASNSVPASAWATLTHVPESALARLLREVPWAKAESRDDTVTVTVGGRAAHAMAPEQGENAIYRLLALLLDYGLVQGDAAEKLAMLRACFPDDYGTGLGIAYADDLSGKTTCVGGMLRLEKGILAQNINVRYAITQDTGDLLKALSARCDSAGIRIDHLEYSVPRYTAPDLPETTLLLDTCHELLGTEYTPYVMGGGTHARKFPNALPYGPAVMDFANPYGHPHGVDEAVCIDHLTQAVKVYILALTRLDKHLAELPFN